MAASSISPRAYLKLVLHAAKYQSRACIGLLVAQPATEGDKEAGAAASASSSSGGASSRTTAVRVIDVLPLFHTAPLAPMIELALSQADTLLRTAYPADAFIAGLYYAPELYEPRTGSSGEHVLPLPQASVVVKMADKLAANGGGAAGSRIIMLDNVRLGALGAPNSESTHSALEWFECRSGRTWSSTGAVQLAESAGGEGALEGAIGALRSIIKDDRQRGLCDFDDHLDDAQADWTNREFEEKVLPTMAK